MSALEIFDIMDEYEKNEKMQMLTLEALSSKVSSVANDDKKVAVEKVLRAMDTFTRTVEIQETACFLLAMWRHSSNSDCIDLSLKINDEKFSNFEFYPYFSHLSLDVKNSAYM